MRYWWNNHVVAVYLGTIYCMTSRRWWTFKWIIKHPLQRRHYQYGRLYIGGLAMGSSSSVPPGSPNTPVAREDSARPARSPSTLTVPAQQQARGSVASVPRSPRQVGFREVQLTPSHSPGGTSSDAASDRRPSQMMQREKTIVSAQEQPTYTVCTSCLVTIVAKDVCEQCTPPRFRWRLKLRFSHHPSTWVFLATLTGWLLTCLLINYWKEQSLTSPVFILKYW